MRMRPLPSPVTPVPYFVLGSGSECGREFVGELPNRQIAEMLIWRVGKKPVFTLSVLCVHPGRRYENISWILISFTLLS
jgi:hypothetical protein